MPTLLLNSETVFVQDNNRTNKYDLVVDRVDSIEANTLTSITRQPRTTVSTKQLASSGKINSADNLTQAFVPLESDRDPTEISSPPRDNRQEEKEESP